jgi:hypothetical protein
MLIKKSGSLASRKTDFQDRSPPGNCRRKFCATQPLCLRNFFASTNLFSSVQDQETR